MLTPYEFNQHSRGYWDRIGREVDTERAIAWSIAALSRSKTLPSYEKWMGKSESRVLVGKELEERKAQHSSLIQSYQEAKSRSLNGDQSR